MVVRKLAGFLLVLAVAWTTAPPSIAGGPEERTFALDLRHRSVTGGERVIRVKQGDTVTLRWTTDEAVTIHLHGYDIERVVKPGTVSEFTVKAYATGRFPITAHGFGERPHGKGHAETPLVYLEVLPH